MNYAIFRSSPIYTLKDLAQIGSHNKREKKSYNSNPDIKIELTKNNIELVPLDSKYVNGFHELTKEYRIEHDERMKTEREDRKRTYSQMLDRSKNVVADELLFTATNKFFENMNEEDIKLWANTCMDFVYNDLGYKKEQVLHATIHMDEKTPHIHCVVVPLIKKLDKRTNTERYTISKKQNIKDKIHLSELQDKYHHRLVDNGFDLERGVKGDNKKHITIKEYKKLKRNLNKELNNKHERLDNSISEINNNMKDSKNVLFDKDYVKVKKETFNSMNNIIKETNNLMKVQEKVEVVFEEIDNQVKSYNFLKKEVNNLEKKNKELKEENNILKEFIYDLLNKLKHFFRKILLIGDNKSKDLTSSQVKEINDYNQYDDKDVYQISKGTTKQDELFEYACIPNYMKEKIKYNEHEEETHDDFEL